MRRVVLVLALAVGALGALPALQAQEPASSSVLARGAQGEEVLELQRRLSALGYTLVPDGAFGAETEGAVRAFQRAQGLSVDGKVGPATRARLARPGGGAGGLAPALGRSPDPSGPRARAQAARAVGRRTLVVAFEGLWSYRGSYTRALLRYQDRRRRGAAARPPTAPPLSSYVSQRLIAPLLAEGGPDVALFSETSETADASEALDTVLAWRQVLGSELRLVVVGHSFGGLAALRLARKLGARGVEVQHLLTLDPRAPTAAGYREFVTPSGVREHHTYYRRGWWLPGRPIEGSQNHRLQGVGHTAVPGAPEVRARFQAMLGD